MKKMISLAVAVSMLLTMVVAQTNGIAADNIIGTYWSPKKDAKIEIYKKENKYFGKSTWLLTKRKDQKNPNTALRERDLLGVELLTNFSYKDGAYGNGEIYDPESGKTYNCKISFNGRNLKVRGYIGISLLGRTEVFERIN